MAHEVLAQELWTWILTYSQVKRCGLGPRQSGDLEPKIPYKASTLQRLYPEGKDRGDTFSLHRRTRKHTHLYLSFQWGKTTKDLENYEPWAYTLYVCVPAKALQSCLILCDSMDCTLPMPPAPTPAPNRPLHRMFTMTLDQSEVLPNTPLGRPRGQACLRPVSALQEKLFSYKTPFRQQNSCSLSSFWAGEQGPQCLCFVPLTNRLLR